MGYKFRGQNLDQGYLLPPDMRDWLPDNHLVFFLIEIIDKVDIKPIMRRFRNDGKGGAPYDPRLILAVLCYSYANGIVSSRKIERFCREDVACRIAAHGTNPDHVTLCRFRRQSGELFEQLFTSALRLCAKAGLVDPSLIAIDGTKVKADASLDKSYTVDRLAKLLVEAAEATDQVEQETVEQTTLEGQDPNNTSGGGLVDRDLARPGPGRTKRIEQALADLEAEHARDVETKNRYPRKKANTTDPDSRVMKGRHGTIQGYNAQAAVTQDQVIVAAGVYTDRTDYNLMEPMIDQTRENLEDAGLDNTGSEFLLDAGYLTNSNASKDNVLIAVGQGHHVDEVAEKKLAREAEKNRVFTQIDAGVLTFEQGGQQLKLTVGSLQNLFWVWRRKRREAGGGENPATGLTPINEMARKLQTEQGRAKYKKRSVMVEPVFGQIKHSRRFPGFSTRGLGAVRGEWKLVCGVHNLLKLVAHQLKTSQPLPSVT